MHQMRAQYAYFQSTENEMFTNRWFRIFVVLAAAGVDWTLIKETGQHPFDAYYVYGDASARQPLCYAIE